MGDKLVPTSKAPKNRSLAIRLIAKFYQLRMLLFGRSARALKTLAMESSLYLYICKGCPKKIVPRLCSCCGGAVDSIISVFTQLHRTGSNLEFEILLESITHVVAELWQRKGKISGCIMSK